MLVQTAEVDEVRKEPGERELRLYLVVEPGEWLLPRALWLLQEKLNAYASFVLDGKLRELYPWASPRDVRIVVRSHGQPPAQVAPFLEHVNQMLQAAGPRVTLERLPAG